MEFRTFSPRITEFRKSFLRSCRFSDIGLVKGENHTYDTLWKTEIVSRSGGGRLVRATGVTQYSQLLRARDTAFAECTNLNPICTDRLIRVYNEVVSFACKSRVSVSLLRRTIKNAGYFALSLPRNGQ